MSLAPIPTKTPLGQDALRRRTGELGQRHRTILFLIDGRRTLAEVLGLAHQAGASTTHFEDLVRLGYVQLPAEEPTPAPPVAELPEPAQPAAEARITHLELEVPGNPAAPAGGPGPEPVSEPVPVYADTVPGPMPTLPEPEPLPLPPVQAVASAPPPAPAALRPVPAAGPAPVAPRALPPRPVPPPALADDDAPLLERVRGCLLDTLRVDPQPAGNRIAERARQAHHLADMIEVVWVMERGLSHAQRSHRGLQNLQKARELLGLGNTLVDEDSRPSRLDDDAW